MVAVHRRFTTLAQHGEPPPEPVQPSAGASFWRSAQPAPASHLGGGVHALDAHVARQQQLEQSAWGRRVPDLSSTLVMIAEEEPLWGVGLGLMIIGTIASSVGMLCFKRAGAPDAPPWYRNFWFFGGVLLFVVTAAGLDTIVFAVTPLGLIAPFAGLTIVVSFILASLGCMGVHEPATKTAALAVLLIVSGVTVCAVFGPKTSGSLSPTDLQRSFDYHPWLYVVCACAAPSLGVFTLLGCCYKKEVRRLRRHWGGALALAAAASTCGAFTQLQFKALASAIVEVVRSPWNDEAKIDELYGSPREMVLQLACVASTGLGQIGFLNYAISGAPVAYTVPAYQAGLLLFTLTLSGFVLDEYSEVEPIPLAIFYASATLIVLGIMLNAWGLRHQMADEDADDDGASSQSTPPRKKAPWEDDYPGVSSPEEAAQARRAASAKFDS
jgi:hypothetical protein